MVAVEHGVDGGLVGAVSHGVALGILEGCSRLIGIVSCERHRLSVEDLSEVCSLHGVGECAGHVEGADEEVSGRDALVDHCPEGSRAACGELHGRTVVAVDQRCRRVFVGLGRAHAEAETRVAVGPFARIAAVVAQDMPDIIMSFRLQLIVLKVELHRVVGHTCRRPYLHRVVAVPVPVLRDHLIVPLSAVLLVDLAAGHHRFGTRREPQCRCEQAEVSLVFASYLKGDEAVGGQHILCGVGQLIESSQGVVGVQTHVRDVALAVERFLFEAGTECQRSSQQGQCVDVLIHSSEL